MHLSRLTLNPRTRRVQRELADPYQLHRTLMRCFPDGLESPEHERVLFRVDTDRRTDVPVVLMQSHLAPEWGWLAEPGARGYLMSAPESKEFTLALAPGQPLAFRLRANPTVRRGGKRQPLYREEDQLTWLTRKGEQGGFRVLHSSAVQEGDQTAWVHRDEGILKATLFAVRFDGLLHVTDPERLWRAVCTGIGSGKGLGFGLLSLAPPA